MNMTLGIRVDVLQLKNHIKRYGGVAKLAMALNCSTNAVYSQLRRGCPSLSLLNEYCYHLGISAYTFIVFYPITEEEVQDKIEIRKRLVKIRKIKHNLPNSS